MSCYKGKLRIAYFLSVANDYVGGADNTLFMQAVLMNACHEVTIVLPCNADGKHNTLFQKKCKTFGLDYVVLEYSTANSMKIINIVDYRNDVDGIVRFIEEKQIDILHSVQINVAVEYVSRKSGIPHIMNIYSLDAWEWTIPRADIFPRYVSSDSAFFLEKWKAYVNCGGSCVRVFDEMKTKKKSFCADNVTVVGTSGTICEYKNQMEIIRAVKIEKKRGRKIRLLLAGDAGSAYAEKCRSCAEAYGICNDVEFMGFIEDMTLFFEQIDVLICGSRRESFPASVVEALSCNIPVISTPVAGIPEILVNGQNAYLSGGYLAEDLAEALEDYFKDCEDNHLERVLSDEKETYRKFFSAGAVTRQLDALYQSVLEKPGTAADLGSWKEIEDEIGKMLKKLEKKWEETDDAEDVLRIHSRLLYLYRIREKITGNECYIWGAGKWGKLTRFMIESLMSHITVKAFVDEKGKQGTGGPAVIKKEEMDLREDTMVFIAFTQNQEEAVRYLEDRNRKMMKNVFIIA